MLLDPCDLIARVILETGSWDLASWKAIEQNLEEGATFVDVGAHQGYCSLKAARAVGPSGRVIAVEPNPAMIDLLRNNIKASGARVITVVQVACSDCVAVADLFGATRSNTGSSSISKTNASCYGPATDICQVSARPLDDIVRENGLSRVDVVKIDVEGAELLVLKGAQETLTSFRPVILLELDDSLLKSFGTTSAEVIAFLKSNGYTPVSRHDEANFEFHPYPAKSVSMRIPEAAEV